MISSADFNSSLPRARWGASAPLIAPEEGASTAQGGEANDLVSGKSHDRQRAVLMSASGQLRGRLRAVSRDRRHSVLVIEVRDWASLNEADRHIKRETAGLPRVSYRRSGRRHELRHPGLVAREHAQLIASFCGAFQKGSTVRAAAYLPNAQAPLIRRLERDASSDPSAQDAPEVSFFGQDTVADLTDYLKAHFDSGPEAAGRSKELADRYLADRFRPTADLLGDATAQLDRATEFQLTPDQQRIVDEVSKDVIEAMAPRRTLFAGAGRPSEQEDRKGQVVIVEGSPGTGKTVVGVELLKNAWRRGWNARYASPPLPSTKTCGVALGLATRVLASCSPRSDHSIHTPAGRSTS